MPQLFISVSLVNSDLEVLVQEAWEAHVPCHGFQLTVPKLVKPAGDNALIVVLFFEWFNVELGKPQAISKKGSTQVSRREKHGVNTQHGSQNYHQNDSS